MTDYPDPQMTPAVQNAQSVPNGAQNAAKPKLKDGASAKWKIEPELLLDPFTNCKTFELENGDAVVVFRIPDAVTLRRLKLRAGPQDLATHLWENLLKRVVSSYVY